MATMLSSQILTNNEIEYMQEKIQILLSSKGVKVEHPQALEKLQKAGAEVDFTSSTVKFPKKLVDQALSEVPKSFTLAAPDSKNDLVFPHPQGLFYTRTCTGGMNYLTEDDEYHNVTLDEVGQWIRLINSLEHINFCALPSTSSKDVPAETVDIHTLRTVLENTKKHIWIQPYEAGNVKYLIELAAARVGGSEELRKRPIISFIACSNTPLQYKYMDVEAILECCANGVPIQPCSLPTSGANAPITLPGTVMMAATEVLAMIIMAQIFAPGTPVIATPLLFAMDMLTTYTLQSPIEVTMGRMAAMQLFTEGYGIPAHSYGTGTDSFILDGQSMIERTSLTQMMALSGGSVLGGAGQIEVAKTISPIQLIIDNDIFGMTKKLKSGMEVNDDTLAWQEVLNLSGRDSFVDMDHTYEHFRETYRPKTFSREARPNWIAKGSKDLVARAKEAYQEIKENYEAIVVPQNVLDQMDSIVKNADKELIK